MNLKNISKYTDKKNSVYAYKVLKDNIMNLHLKPGEKLSELEIGRALNLSRAPVREAIVNLKREKLIEVFPQSGSFISKLDSNLIDEAHFMRNIIEGRVLELICQKDNNEKFIRELENIIHQQKSSYLNDKNIYEFFRLDNKFHQEIYREAGKENIWNSISAISTHYERLRLICAMEREGIDEPLKDHQEILAVIRNKPQDREEIYRVVESHLHNFMHMIPVLKLRYPQYFKEESQH